MATAGICCFWTTGCCRDSAHSVARGPTSSSSCAGFSCSCPSAAANRTGSRRWTSVNDDPNQYFLYTDLSDWDWLFGRSHDKAALTAPTATSCSAMQPDIVHFQHTLFIGYDMIRVTRNTLPDAPIVYTLHEYMPICHRNGQMVRTVHETTSAGRRRRGAATSASRSISPQHFFMRERFIKSQLALVDLFIAPEPRSCASATSNGASRADRIMFEELRPAAGRARSREADEDRGRATASRSSASSRRSREPTCCWRRWRCSGDDFDGHLWIHGANLEMQPPEFQERFEALLEADRAADGHRRRLLRPRAAAAS